MCAGGGGTVFLSTIPSISGHETDRGAISLLHILPRGSMVPKTLKGMVFGTRDLKYWVLGLSGLGMLFQMEIGYRWPQFAAKPRSLRLSFDLGTATEDCLRWQSAPWHQQYLVLIGEREPCFGSWEVLVTGTEAVRPFSVAWWQSLYASLPWGGGARTARKPSETAQHVWRNVALQRAAGDGISALRIPARISARSRSQQGPEDC